MSTMDDKVPFSSDELLKLTGHASTATMEDRRSVFGSKLVATRTMPADAAGQKAEIIQSVLPAYEAAGYTLPEAFFALLIGRAESGFGRGWRGLKTNNWGAVITTPSWIQNGRGYFPWIDRDQAGNWYVANFRAYETPAVGALDVVKIALKPEVRAVIAAGRPMSQVVDAHMRTGYAASTGSSFAARSAARLKFLLTHYDQVADIVTEYASGRKGRSSPRGSSQQVATNSRPTGSNPQPETGSGRVAYYDARTGRSGLVRNPPSLDLPTASLVARVQHNATHIAFRKPDGTTWDPWVAVTD